MYVILFSNQSVGTGFIDIEILGWYEWFVKATHRLLVLWQFGKSNSTRTHNTMHINVPFPSSQPLQAGLPVSLSTEIMRTFNSCPSSTSAAGSPTRPSWPSWGRWLKEAEGMAQNSWNPIWIHNLIYVKVLCYLSKHPPLCLNDVQHVLHWIWFVVCLSNACRSREGWCASQHTCR